MEFTNFWWKSLHRWCCSSAFSRIFRIGRSRLLMYGIAQNFICNLLAVRDDKLLEILVQIFNKRWQKFESKSWLLIRWWNILPAFGTRFPHVLTTEIYFTIVWRNLVPNVSRLFHHLTFWSTFYHALVKRWTKITNSALI